MSSWKPDNVAVVQLATLLKNCMSPNHDERTTAMDALQQFQLQPEFFNYLCYILIEGETDEVLKSNFSPNDLQNNRATAGMLLKNSMLEKGGFGKGNHDLEYIKTNIIHGLYNPNILISNVTGIVITTLFSTYYRQHREDPTGVQMLSQLLELVSNGNVASIKAISKIMEDSAQFFQLEWAGNVKPIETLVESFLKFITEPLMSSVIRAESIKCINTIIPLQTQSFIVRIDQFLELLFHLAQSDEDDEVRTQTCIAFSFLLEFRPDKLVDHLSGIIQYMLHIIGTVYEEKVAIEACEFLHAFATNSNIPEHLVQPYIADVVPVLLAKMVYNEDSILVLESSNDDDAYLEDKDEDIKPIAPRIVKKKDNTDSKADGNDADDDEDDDEGDDDIDTQWNLRKCSASTLDVLTNILPHAVIDVAFPFLKEHLTSDKWYIREATVLALGAMAEGGMTYFNDQLPVLIPFLVEQLKDHWAPVRKITCWTLSRFSPWILKDHVEFLIPVLEPIIITLMDKKKDVQEAAISSVAVFIENCDPELIETLLYSELLKNFEKCFQFYKKRNLIILYDAVGRFAEKCELDDAAMQTLLPHLISKWELLSDDDKELWPLLECLSCVASSLGEKFAPMASEVYNRAHRILIHCIELDKKSQIDPTTVVPEKDFLITSIDLIDGLVQGLGPQSQELLFPQNGQDTTFLEILLECLQDPVHEVRQSCYALLGDIVYFYKPDIVIIKLQEFLKIMGLEFVHNTGEEDTSGIPALINAIWCLGLISERINLSSCIVELSKYLLDLFLNSTITDEAVLENLAITIGRFGMTHPEVFSSGPFANDHAWKKWSEKAMKIENIEEKSSTYMGFIKIVNLIDDGRLMSSATLHKVIKGLTTDVDFKPFITELYDFMVRHTECINQLNLSQEEMSFLSQLH
ncbi:Importin subunit beta-2 [Nakaseomyces bracarensis]|uniref:Importin subunit beta-2 n=1 Tax=Nakaseomyces bracarensis TaxID=273131 RepID=A0ABR4NVS1_9SACH